jgi:hypothetical protein
MKERSFGVGSADVNRMFYEYVTSNVGIPKPEDVFRYVHQFETNAVLHTLIDYKATKASQIKPLLYRVKDKGAEKEFKSMNTMRDISNDAYFTKKLKDARKRGLEEIDLRTILFTDSLYPLKRLLERPGGDLSRWDEFIYALSATYDITGWALIKKSRGSLRSNNGQLVKMSWIPTQYVDIVGGSPVNPISGYIYNGDSRIELPASDCVPIRSFSTLYDKSGSNLYGTSKVKAAYRDLMTYNESKERQYTAFKTGDSAHLIFPKYEGNQIEGEEAAGILNSFRDMIFGGLKKKDRHSAAVLGVSVETANLASPLKDAQTIETQQEIRDILASLWKLPPRLVFNDARSATYNNMDQDKKNALYNGVFPFLYKIEKAIGLEIIEQEYPDIKFAFDYDVYPELMPNITDDMVKVDKVSFLTDDEKRDMFGYEPLPDNLGEIPAKYQHISVQAGEGTLTPGMQQGNGTFNRGNLAQQAAGYDKRTGNQN